MHSFTDNAGRSWTIEINVSTIKRVRGLAGVDLLEVLDGSLIERLVRDPVLLCDVVFAVCKPQADASQPPVSDEEFGTAMAGDPIEHATQALLDELVSFSPSPRDRRNLGRVLETTRRVMDRARDLIEAKLDSGALEQAAERTLNELAEPADAQPPTPTDSSGSAPASSASTPTDSPCGSFS